MLTAANGNGMGTPLTIAAQLFPTPKASDGEWGTPRTSGRPIERATHLGTIATLMPTPTPTTQDASNTGGPSQYERNTLPLNTEVTLLPTPRASRGASNTETLYVLGGVRDDEGDEQGNVRLKPAFATTGVEEYAQLWDSLEDQSPFWLTEKGDDYWPAISRWAEVLGRKSPSPTVPDGKDGRHRLNPRFTEWLMGCDDGWLTDSAIWEPLGWTASKVRNAALKAGGNGVVTRQAFVALTVAWPRLSDLWEVSA
jgi:DNA (cytosine-5)-methyltransferase 1